LDKTKHKSLGTNHVVITLDEGLQ